MIKKWIQRFLARWHSDRFILEELTKRDFKYKYKRTVLGMGWSLLSPLLQLLVMRLVFTNFFGRNMPYYTTYLFAGNLFFSFFRESTNNSMTALNSNARIITKINSPKYLFLLSKNIAAIINFCITLVVFFLFAVIDGVPFHASVFLIFYPMVLMTVFNIGVGMVLSAMNVFFRDVQYLYNIFVMLLSYLSAIFYYIDSYPENLQRLFLLNPVYCYIKYVRVIVIDGTVPSFAFHMLLLLYSGAALAAGAAIYKTQNQKFLFYL